MPYFPNTCLDVHICDKHSYILVIHHFLIIIIDQLGQIYYFSVLTFSTVLISCLLSIKGKIYVLLFKSVTPEDIAEIKFTAEKASSTAKLTVKGKETNLFPACIPHRMLYTAQYVI